LAVLAHNGITALKRMALPQQYLTARPKRLRFLIFNTAGRIPHHARRMVCRIAGLGWCDWLRLMPPPTWTSQMDSVSPPILALPDSTLLPSLF